MYPESNQVNSSDPLDDAEMWAKPVLFDLCVFAGYALNALRDFGSMWRSVGAQSAWMDLGKPGVAG